LLELDQLYFTLLDFILFLFYHALRKVRLASAAQDVANERGHMTTRATTDNTGAPHLHREETRESTETKSAYKTTELIVYALAVLGVLIASAIVTDASFGADHAWRYVTYLTVGYLISRGLAKAGSREPYRD
jgi:hypothetical protein